MCRLLTKPKSAYELMMEANRRKQTLMFTDDICPRCQSPIRTDGKTLWCTNGCIHDNKSVKPKEDRDYMGFISDLIR
jgi:hypothetical protein